jgi:Fe-S oxidoreductase
VLYQYQEKHGYKLRNYLFGNIGLINWLTAPISSIYNSLSQTSWIMRILEMIGITKNRPLPKLAKQRFSSWFLSYKQIINPLYESKKVVLFNDTYNEFNEPHIGISAVKVLNRLGFEVIVPPWKCCGRPMISKGLLKQAKKKALTLQALLLPYAKAGLPIIGLEPSCILTIKDDFEALIGSVALEIRNVSITFDEFIHQHLDKLNDVLVNPNNQKIVVHGHCHQKSLVGMKPTFEVLKKLKHLDVKEIDSGCCGMAGSFGYEKEHYDFSMKIGNLKLFPAIKKVDDKTLILANGISCRTQILQGTGKQPKHLAEILFEQF